MTGSPFYKGSSTTAPDVYQLTSVVSGGLAPFVATLLLSRRGSTAVAAYMICVPAA